MKRALAPLLLISFLLAAAAPLLAAEGGSEDRLRRRVKRFYVLNYLNRYGEMWEMFSGDLRERLGGDRQDYVKSSRRSGFELYSSRIEDVRLKGAVASVEVVVQAQLAGSLDVTSRRHRMLWRYTGKDWRYAGSIDVTHSGEADESVDVAELQPPASARAPVVEGAELLPPRLRVEPPAPRAPEQTRAASTGPGERWDLVAVPPPGKSAPAPSGDSVAARESEAEVPAAIPAEPERRVTQLEPAEREWLPPEMASAPPPPPPPAPGQEAVGSVEEYDEGSRLVRKAVTGLLPRRVRALTRLRSLNEPRLAELMARALPDAPRASAEVFLAELARYRAFGEVEVVMQALQRKETPLRIAAARALVILGDASHAERLAAVLDAEGDDAAFAQELRAFAAVAGEAAGPRIAAALAGADTGPRTRAAAARAAGACGCEGVEEPLLALLRRERKPAVARVGLLAAGRLGGVASLDLLEEVAEQRQRLPAEAADDLDGVLEARRGLALAGVAGSGDALAALLLHRGMSALSEDVVLVASTGDRDALLSLLSHPQPAIRRRTADLLGRVIETEQDAARALAVIERVLLDEGDTITFDALLDARERLETVPSS